MTDTSLTILSYHRFTEKEESYPFSRTYDQFSHDIRKKAYDLITIDDGRSCQIKACKMMTAQGIRAKLFISTALVGTEGYCTWDELRDLAKGHDIENHSHEHLNLTRLSILEIKNQILTAQEIIEREIGIKPSYFVAPWNQYNDDVDEVVKDLGLQSLKDRVNILNTSK